MDSSLQHAPSDEEQLFLQEYTAYSQRVHTSLSNALSTLKVEEKDENVKKALLTAAMDLMQLAQSQIYSNFKVHHGTHPDETKSILTNSSVDRQPWDFQVIRSTNRPNDHLRPITLTGKPTGDLHGTEPNWLHGVDITCQPRFEMYKYNTGKSRGLKLYAPIIRDRWSGDKTMRNALIASWEYTDGKTAGPSEAERSVETETVRSLSSQALRGAMSTFASSGECIQSGLDQFDSSRREDIARRYSMLAYVSAREAEKVGRSLHVDDLQFAQEDGFRKVTLRILPSSTRTGDPEPFQSFKVSDDEVSGDFQVYNNGLLIDPRQRYTNFDDEYASWCVTDGDDLGSHLEKAACSTALFLTSDAGEGECQVM